MLCTFALLVSLFSPTQSVAQQSVPLPLLQESGIEASDGTFEDRVEVTWPELGPDSSQVDLQIYRDTEVNGTLSESATRIGTAASDATLFADTDGFASVVYEYCVIADDGTSEAGPFCETGYRELNPPANTVASDRDRIGAIEVIWDDRSSVNDAYRVTRDGGEVALLQPGARQFTDVMQDRASVAVDIYPSIADGAPFPDLDELEPALTGLSDRIAGVSLPFSISDDDAFAPVRHRTVITVTEGGSYTFTITEDAKRLLVNGNVVVEKQNAPPASGTVSLSEGEHTLTVESLQYVYARQDVSWEGPEIEKQELFPEVLSLPDDGVQRTYGASYDYYEGPGLMASPTLPDFDEMSPTASGVTAGIQPPAVSQNDDYAVYHRATLSVPETGTYQFEYTSGTGFGLELNHVAMIRINGEVIGENEGGDLFASADLNAGTHDFEFIYGQEGNASFLPRPVPNMTWNGPSFEGQAFPMEVLSVDRVPHTYCITALEDDIYTSESDCAAGRSGVALPPLNMLASDGQYDDRIFLTWEPDGNNEGFEITRSPIGTDERTVLTTTIRDTRTFSDEAAELGVEYEYCVRTLTAEGFVSRAACDTGIRGRLPAPAGVTASVDVHDDRIELDWNDRATSADAYHIYRRPLDRASNVFSLADAVPGASYEYTTGGFIGFPDFDELRPDETGVVPEMTADPVSEDDLFALRYRAVLDIDEADTYTFTIESGEPARMWVGDELVAESGVGEGPTPQNIGLSTPIDLEARPYPIRVEYVHTVGTPDLSVSWAGTSGSSQPLVGEVLRPDLGEQISTLGAGRTELTDNDAEPGVPYIYHVVAVAIDGGLSMPGSDWGQRSEVLAPAFVTATDSTHEDRVALQWDTDATRAAIHRVYRDGERIQTLSVPENQFDDFESTADTQHTYCIEAVTDLGVVSDQVCDAGSRHLIPPTDLQAGDGSEERVVRLVWDNNSAVTDSTHIYRDGSPIDVIPASRTEYTDATSTPGTEHTYRIYQRSDAPGRSGDIETTGSRSFNTPEDLVASQGAFEEKIELTWVDASRAEEGYRIYRSRDGEGEEELVAELDRNTTSYADTEGIGVGAEYTYTVVPFDEYGESSSSRATGFTTLQPPASLRASTNYEGEVVLVWDDVSGVNTGYQVTKNGRLITDTLDPTSTSFSHDTVDGLGMHTYCVGTIGAEGVLSEEVCAEGEGVPIVGRGIQSFGKRADAFAFMDVEDRVAIDVVYVDGESGLLGWYRHDASDGFNRQDPIAEDIGSRPVMATGDLNGDGREDILVASETSGGVRYFENDGNGSFAEQPLIAKPNELDDESWAETTAISDIALADLDESGTLDLLVAYRVKSNTAVKVFKNSPEGEFAFDSSIETSSGPERFPVEIHVADIYSGGRPDLIIWHNTNEAQTGDDWLFTYRNQSNRERIAISSAIGGGFFEGDGVTQVSVADFDGNGFSDVLIATDEIVVFKHESGLSERYSRGITYDVETTRSLTIGALAVGDVNGNGRNDVVASIANGTDGDLVWYENQIGESEGAFSGQIELLQRSELNHTLALRGPSVTSPRLASSGEDGIRINAGRLGISDGTTDPDVETPASVTASNGTRESQVRIRWERSAGVEGYRIYRDGGEIGTVDAEDTSFDDNDARPGLVSAYCIEAFDGDAVSEQSCDYGHRPPDGALTGRVATIQSSGVQDVDVCVLPDPGRSLQLDGVGGTAVTRGPVVLNEGDFSISFWVKRAAQDGGQYVITQGERSTNRGLHAGFRSVNEFTFAFWGNDINIQTPPSTEWEHWAVTYERASGQRYIYRNGEQVASDLSNGRYEGGGAIYIGSRFAEEGYLQGLVDEVRVWDYVRSGEEIQADRFSELTGAESGLQAYWPAEQGTGAALADPTDTEGTRYAVFEGGAYRSETTAPLDVCTQTDDQGNYEIAGIRYGNETTFQVTPSRGNREFDPARTEITLSTGNPVENEVGFTDISSFNVEGSVQIAGSQCFVPELSIGLDGEVAGQTDSDGFYALAAESGTYTLAPSPVDVDEEAEPRVFQIAGPASDEAYEIDVRSDLTGLDFVETTQRTLRGVAGGGSCGIDIGTVDLRIESEDQCFSRTVSIDTSEDPEYVIDDLPPLVYNVSVADVSNVPDGLSRVDILSFFENAFGTQQVDLTTASDTLDVTYRAPLAVSFEGLPERAPQCSSGLTIENRTVGNVPVIEQSGDAIPYQIRVAEDYGASGMCPVAEGEVEVFDEWRGTENEPRVLEVEDGIAQDTTAALEPSFTSREVDGIDRTFQQALTASADVGGRTATETTWGLIEGRRTREGTDFVSGQTGPIPLQILRNPPGDGSSSFVEEGSKFCRTVGTTTTLTQGLKQEASVSAGAEFYKGFGFVTRTELTTELGTSFEMTWEAVNKFGSRICAESQERFSTSTNPVLAGEQGDVFIGTAVNMLFAETDVMEQTDSESCELERFTEVGYEPEEFDTIYAFSRFHIENNLIPRLSDLMDDARRQAEGGNTEAEGRLADLEADSTSWMGHLHYNDSLKTEAELVENRSFDAGANYTFSNTSQSTFDWSFETSIKAELSAFAGFEVEESGVGIKGKFTASSALRQAINAGVSTQDTRTVGYTLSDGDVGDYFTVDIKDDPVYNTPVFDMRGGQSSCPVEGPITRLDGTEIDGTVPRYKADIQANGSPVREGVPPDEPAVFELTLTNDSPSGEAAGYEIRQIHSSNPNGARLSINGNGLGGALEYYLEPGEDGSQLITLEVARGATGYRYEDLQLMMYPPCERSLWQDGADLQMADTLSVSVQFEAPCTDVELFRPRENWTVNAADDDLETIFSNFSLNDPRELEEIGLQYRRSGQEGWTDAFRITADDVQASGTESGERYELSEYWQEVTNLPDGEYELRAYSFCDGADRRVYSLPALGQKDTKRPEVLANPEPSNRVLSFGGEVAVQFDEEINCTSVVTEGEAPTVELLDDAGERIAIDTQCTGDQIVIAPRAAEGFNPFEGQTLTAEVRGTVDLQGEITLGLTDPAGNPLDTVDPLSDTESWSFDVRRQQFAWQRSEATEEVEFQNPGLFEETLTNGSPQPVVYELESDTYGTDWIDHSWLTLDEPTGTLPAGERRAIVFNVSDDLDKGTYTDRISANSAVGGQDLDVTAEVTCSAPFGTPPVGAAHTMNATARLDIPAGLGGDGVSTTEGDKVAAFVGSQLRGVAPLEAVNIGGQTAYRAFLTIASDRRDGETVTFQIWDSDQCTVFQTAETYPFQANDVLGDAEAPITFTATDASMQSVPLAEGWTWISVNTETEDNNSVNQVLSTLIPNADDLVKSQTAFSQFGESQGEWVGSLNAIDPGSGYLIQLAESSTLFLLGDPVAVDEQPVTLTDGWNWLGFVPQQAMPINHALQDLEPGPEPGDIIKSQTAFAQYVNENVGWLGSLETMRPGRGYFLRLSAEATLTYPDELPTQTTVRVRAVGESTPNTAPHDEGGRLMAEVPVLFSPEAAMASRSEDQAADAQDTVSEAMPEWTVVPADYEVSMAIVAALQADGTTLSDPRTRIGAFVDGDLRGVARPQQIDQQAKGGTYRAFLTVHGEPGFDDEVTFRLFNPHTGQVHERVHLLSGVDSVDEGVPAQQLPTSITFQSNQPVGTVNQPVRLNVGDLPEDWGPGEFVLEQNFPNPVRSTTTLRFAIPEEDHVTVELYDLIGRRVQTIADTQMRAGWHELPFDASRLASGVYFYRLSAGDYRASEKMTIVR